MPMRRPSRPRPGLPGCSPELEQEDVRTHSNYNAAAFLVTGSYPEFGDIRSLTVGSGRYYNWDDENNARRVAFLGSDAAKQLFPGGRKTPYYLTESHMTTNTS